MKIVYLFLISIVLLSIDATGQEVSTLFKANSYSEAYFNPVYQELKQRRANDILLSEKEEQWLDAYQKYLDNYFTLLNSNQQNAFHEKRATYEYSKNRAFIFDTINNTNLHVTTTERDNELLFGHILFSGISGVFYGLQLNYIADVNHGSTRIGLPMLISGASMLIPVFSPKYDSFNTNSLWLRIHGKTMGSIYGYFLSGAIFGEDIFESYTQEDNGNFYGSHINRNKKPLALTTSLLSSIALGHLGFHFGKVKPWTDGRIATYQYYSYTIPTLACGLLFGLSEKADFQAYSALIATGVPLGYLAGHQVANKIEYTRGDVNAITNNSAIGAAIGASILLYADPSDQRAILIPLSTALLGSAVGHYTYRNFHITRPESRRLNYATIGGGLIGLGIAAMVDPDNDGSYFLIPSLLGTLGYGILLSYYKNQPRFASAKNTNTDFRFSLHPESLIINKELPVHMQAPLFSMSWRL
ncbi:MAG: hypothetical protein PF517_06145 [Salinivirgaceae bacterium]|jgi:hypothetical protein|nr:hypothetical protein [Salinivirgaceae bacterium]